MIIWTAVLAVILALCLSKLGALKHGNKEESPKPYRLFNHPYKSVLDEIITYIFFNVVLSGHSFQTLPIDIEVPETKKLLTSFRDTVIKQGAKTREQEIKSWNLSHEKHNAADINNTTYGDIKQFTSQIPRQQNILSDWGITDTKAESNNILDNNSSLKQNEHALNVTITASISLIHADNTDSSSMHSLSLSTLKDQIGKLPSSVQVVLSFWGGGLTVKGDIGMEIKLARLLVDSQYEQSSLRKDNDSKEKEVNRASSVPNFVLITPDYRLAPENPFPAAIIDALSTLDFVIAHVPNQVPIHIFGVSAGGNLAATLVLEANRKFPGRIKGAYLWDPMLSPKCDSMSYYLNSRSGLTSWLIWSWRAYLSLHGKDNDKSKDKNVKGSVFFDSYEDFVKYGSNHGAVNESALYNDSPELWRLVEPIKNIPQKFDSENAPVIVISTSLADPLHDEGVLFGNNLKLSGANVTMLEARCSHTMGMDLDNTFKERIVKALSDTMLGN